MINDAEVIKRMNKTCRSRGAVGANALVPRFIASCIPKCARILDYGAGKDLIHVSMLREQGFDFVDGYEFGENVTSAHVTNLQPRYYDFVYLSNVFNVQPSPEHIQKVVYEVVRCLTPDWGACYFNYPKAPRYSSVTLTELFELIKIPVFKMDPRGVYCFQL